MWNIAGVDINDAASRSAMLDRCCTEIGRDPAAITRSFHVRASYGDPAGTCDADGAAIDAGFDHHLVLSLPAPYPDDVAQWVADEIVTPSRH